MFAGIPVVDGVSIAHSFSHALQAPVVDAALIISSMGQECDAGPDTDVHAMPLHQWLEVLNGTFNQQPWQYGSEVAAAYATLSAVDLHLPTQASMPTTPLHVAMLLSLRLPSGPIFQVLFTSF